MNAEFVAQATGARVSGADGAAVDFSIVGTDSRSVEPGQLFVALHGERFDGNDFIEDVIAGGAAGIVCDEGRALARPGVVFFEVRDTLRALGDLAAAHRRGFDVPVVAITGSNGKTTTKNLLRSILATALGGPDRVLATEGNLNNLIGMPLTLLAPRHRAAIVEMGMNAFGEIARLTEIAAPTVGLITCVAPAHLEGLGSIEGVAQAKGELFAGLAPTAIAVVNCDDPHISRVAAGLRCRRQDFGADRAVSARGITPDGLRGIRFELVLPGGSAPVRLPLLGRHNVGNAVAAAAAAFALGVGIDAIVAGLESAAPAPMRLSVERLPNGVDLINDAYNANPGSMRAALSALEGVADHCTVVLGEMRELGPGAAGLHVEVGAAVARLRPRSFCAVGAYADDYARGAVGAGMAGEAVTAVATNSAAADAVARNWRAGDAVLVKGSRGARMEEVVTELRRRASA
ncbi:MAG TPA: UDP-N-acetylmuramoyl-tripeptide--D-alanyl-D-alanine ligase [Candidatus Binatia bacterium]|nr:UDP-N-acetylmuramoyl-tripeptide--D-alanyl-D-alanine ligase [Candidatus Binatia bacterium]